MLSAGLVLFMSKPTVKFWLAILAVAVIGFLVEVAGVKTGWIFGHYWYGQALGFKLWEVPLLIGVNWTILLYSTHQFGKPKHPVVAALWSALLMVILDFFIEQNAPRFDFWYWQQSHIPFQNYVAWFIISFGLNLLLQKHLSSHSNPTGRVFYITQLVFFVTLYLLH